MNKKNIFYISLLLFFLQTITSHILIRSPPELISEFNDGPIKMSVSNFGHIPYGHSIVGRVLYDPNVTENQLACTPLNREARENPNVDESPIILIKRGNCSFSEKIYNVEMANGQIAIIMNNVPGPIDRLIMVQDERGKISHIPAVLISKDDGDKIIKFYEKNKDNKDVIKSIRFEIFFEVEQYDGTVNYDLWYSPDIDIVYSMMIGLEKFQKIMKDKAIFNLHAFSYVDFNYDSYSSKEYDNCLGSGRYCVFPVKKSINDGRLVLKESIIQKCVWNFSFNKNKTEIFFKYIKKFYDKCYYLDKFNGECTKNVLDDLEISDEIADCYKNSFENNDKKKNYDLIYVNKLLDEDYKQRRKLMIQRNPSMTINGRLYLGEWDSQLIFEFLCASLIKKPKECYNELEVLNITKKSNKFKFFVIIVIVICINVLIFLFCKNIIKKKIQDRINSTDINSRIDSVVSSYLAMRDS